MGFDYKTGTAMGTRQTQADVIRPTTGMDLVKAIRSIDTAKKGK